MASKRRKRRSSRAKRRVLISQLDPKARETREHALEAVRLMRSRKMFLAQAAREVHASPRTIRKYVGSALIKTAGGRYRAKPSDRFLRTLRFLTPERQIAVDVRGSKLASRIASYWNALDRYQGGGPNALKEFAGKSITIGKQKYSFITDQFTLRRLFNEGQTEFETIYQSNY